jgi:ABC-2 type transport system ATP-binding protein
MIRIEGLHKSFGNHEVLRDVNAEFSSGKIYGIIGENGAGKTTLFRCIAGLEKFDGEIVADLSPLKNHLGFLMTDPFFFPYITGREYIRLLCNARGKKCPDIDSANIFNLPLDKYAVNYSTGMKKKLALMAVLAQDNDYYILDEPFNGIDINGSIIVTEIINRLRDLNKTVILSSHIFSTMSDTCDQIFMLRDGHFAESVDKEDFKKLEDNLKQSAELQEKVEALLRHSF